MHGTDWAQGACGTRERQSPVSFNHMLYAPPTVALDYSYQPITNTKLNLTARGGMLVIELDKDYGGVLFKREWFPLVRIDFHGSAEHLVKGKRQPLEVQLVHRRLAEPARALVISVLVWCEHPPLGRRAGNGLENYLRPAPAAADFNPNFQNFLEARPPAADGESAVLDFKSGKSLDINPIVAIPGVPESSEYFAYAGSLTTPPCGDRTAWFVRRMPLSASDDQVHVLWSALQELTGGVGSYRQVMPWAGRKLRVARLRKAPAAVHSGDLPQAPPLLWGPGARTDGEYKAFLRAHAVNGAVDRVVDYASEIVQRAHSAEMAYAGVLTSAVAKEAAAKGAAPSAGGSSQESVESAAHEALEGVVGSTEAAMRAQAIELRRKAAREAAKMTHLVPE